MVRCLVCALIVFCIAAAPAAAQRQWVVYPSAYDGGFQEHPTGDFDGRAYIYGSGFDGVRRGYWDITAQNSIPVAPNSDVFPAKPALYAVEQWVPSSTPAGVTWVWLPIETLYHGRNSGQPEEGQRNVYIPWSGQYGTNHQWIGMDLNDPAGTWEPAGPGPQAPDGPDCSAWGEGPQSLQMWMKRGSALYTKWNFGWDVGPHAITAVRLTEIFPVEAVCDAATLGGPVDLRCIGNADPLYGTAEVFARSPETTIDNDNALGVENYVVPACPGIPYPSESKLEVPLSPGLPPNGLYTAHPPQGDVTFRFRYDGSNTLKWAGTEFDRNRVFTLNGTAGREFVEGAYRKLHFLTTTSGGNGKFLIQAVYSDSSTADFAVNLYDWFNQDGDAGSVAVGVDGQPRTVGLCTQQNPGGCGFLRINRDGRSDGSGGGGHDGAFLFTHTLAVDPCRTLTQVKLSLSAEAAGSIHVLAATFEAAQPGDCRNCSTPVFDVAGGGVGHLEPDGAVDMTDFAVFQRCFTGPNPTAGLFDAEKCGCLDVNGDEDVDGDDFYFFGRCATGPAPAEPAWIGCDDPGVSGP